MAGRVSIITELLGIDTVARGLEKLVDNLKEIGKTGEGGGAGKVASLTGALGEMALGFAKGAVSVLTFKKGLEETVKVVEESLDRYAEMERITLRMDAVWKATGGSAGVLVGQVAQLSEEIARNSFVTQEQVLQAATSLATFRSIHGEVFKEVLEVSTDVSAALGRDFQSTVFLTGRAIEALNVGQVQGLSRSFRFLSPAIIQNVENLAKMGDRAGAVKALIDGLKASTGGAAAGEHSGLAGAMDSVNKAWEDFEITLGKFITSSTPVESAIHGIGQALQGLKEDLTHIMAPGSNAALQGPLEDAQAKLDKFTKQRGQQQGERQTALSDAALDQLIAKYKLQIQQINQVIELNNRLSAAHEKTAGALARQTDVEAQDSALTAANTKAQVERYQELDKARASTMPPAVQAEKDFNDAKALASDLLAKNIIQLPEYEARVKAAAQAHTEAVQAITQHDRALAGLDLKIQEAKTDLQAQADAAAVSDRQMAITAQLLEYENEERQKSGVLSAERIKQLEAEAAATVDLNAAAQANAAIRGGDTEIKNLQAQVAAQNQSNYARRQTVAMQQAEAKILALKLPLDSQAAQALRDQAAAQFQLNNGLDEAARNTNVNRNIAMLERQIGAVGMLDEQSQEYVLTLEMINEAEDINGTLSDEKIKSIEQQAAAISHLQTVLSRASDRERAQIAGTQQAISQLNSSLGEMGDAMIDAFANNQDPVDALLSSLKDIAVQFAKMILQLGVINPLMNKLFGGTQGYGQQPTLDIGGIFTKALTSIFGGGGGGGSFGGVPSGFKMAGGGDMMVNRPTLFLAGEAGPERATFTPLRSGRGGGGMQVYIDARGADAVALARLQQTVERLDGTFDRRVVGTVVGTRRQGGINSDRLRR